MDYIIIILILQALIFGGFCAFIASEKQRDPVVWFVLGFFFSILAVLALVAIPKLESKVSDIGQAYCPFCKEVIKPDAVICKHCRSDLSVNKSIIGEKETEISAGDSLVEVMNKAKINPPPNTEITTRPMKVKRINPINGNVLFELKFKNGIKYGVVPWDGLVDETLIYSEGNFFLVNKNYNPSK